MNNGSRDNCQIWVDYHSAFKADANNDRNNLNANWMPLITEMKLKSSEMINE